ncbi:hypothetical protein JG687_00002500 [Phytophthora cactorum]|uniref:Uncharacterized protein n=1 Tax=Phytophthora cactorum TaxID=29920 RepID=A0A8T1UUX2_9STRA|nr:hypothetical protein JG687_00002500 [Phytophthora cactorum]
MFQLLGNALVAGDLKVLNRALSSLKEFEGSVSGFVDLKSGNDENRNVDAGVCGSGGVDDCSDNLNAGVCGSSTGLSTSAHAENFSQVVIIIDGDIDDNPSETIGRDTALNEAFKSKSLSKAKSRSEPMVERAHGKPPAVNPGTPSRVWAINKNVNPHRRRKTTVKQRKFARKKRLENLKPICQNENRRGLLQHFH